MKRRTGFKDMTGLIAAGATVLREAEAVRGCARWFCRLACGCEKPVDGQTLRELDKKGRVLRCMTHRIHGSRKKERDLSNAEVYQIEKARTEARIAARTSEKICGTCCGLSWQVVGHRCKECKLRHAPEAPVELDTTSRKAVQWL